MLFLLLLLHVAWPAIAAPRRIALAPPESEVAFRAYGLGLLPLDGHFTRFRGWLSYDPDNHAACQVELTVEVASLVMSDEPTRDTVLGPDFIDAPNHPQLVFVGACQSGGIGGNLTLHGITRPFALSLAWGSDGVVAVGEVRRAEWGMTAMPILAGSTVRIRVTVPLSGMPQARPER